jgi:SSS family solute:Na+ symporter
MEHPGRTYVSSLDWGVLSTYFLLMLVVGIWARTKIKVASDFFTAGGTMPWWLSGISHHMSGYSSAVFVGYAAIAYSSGLNIYIWWACSISLALLMGSSIFPPRWSRLRQRLGVISPLEYLLIRYDLPTQQLLAWSGALLKIFDVGAKWTAAAILLQVFANVPLMWGVLLTGGVTVIYSVVGGLWADALTDLSQFIIQIIAGVVMLVAVFGKLGGVSALWTIWHRLPPSHSHAFTGQYTLPFALIYLMVNTLSYNGGTWSLAQRFIATPTGSAARKAALLSSGLYLIWPPVLFFPMWAAPLLLPHLPDPSQSYALLVGRLLPSGLVGLVLAGLFAHTMAMTSSDANATSAVVVRDILPALRGSRSSPSDKSQLFSGRICTFVFLALSMMIALTADHFGGVVGLLILWYGALIGPIAMPMLLGMLGAFRRSGPAAAISSWVGGAVAFGLIKFIFAARIAQTHGDLTTTLIVGGPILVSLATYIGVALVWPSANGRSNELLQLISSESPSQEELASWDGDSKRETV